MDVRELEALVAEGEREMLEFKKTTGLLKTAGETLCAFLNGGGGRVLIGVNDKGRIVGQDVADTTLREVAATLKNLEPAAAISIERIPVAGGKEVISLHAPPGREQKPYAFRGRFYQRVGTTTSIMPQERITELVLEREHSRHRWENHAAEGVSLAELDSEAIWLI